MTGHQQGIMIDAIYSVDPTHPIIAEDDHYNGKDGTPVGPGIYQGNTTAGHACVSQHYQDYRPWKSTQMITQLGEFSDGFQPMPHPCTGQAIVREGDLGLDMRLRDVAGWQIWHILGWWPNFIEGGSRALGESGETRWHNDRKDGIDGWGSPEIVFLQRCLDPYIIVDKAIQAANICYTTPWPATVPSYNSGTTISRSLEVFNGGLFGDSLNVLWEARWDSSGGKVAASGFTGMFAVQPGFHVTKTVSFVAPATTATVDTIAITQGTVMSKENRVYYNVNSRKLYVIYKSVIPTAQLTANRPPAIIPRQFDGTALPLGIQGMKGSMLGIPTGNYRLVIIDARGKTLLRESGIGPKTVDINLVGSGMRIVELSTEKTHAIKTVFGVK
jgi:hypothetical protein